MLDARDFLHHAFERISSQGGYLLGRSAGKLEEDVRHGDGDLRVFLAGREIEAQHAEQ